MKCMLPWRARDPSSEILIEPSPDTHLRPPCPGLQLPGLDGRGPKLPWENCAPMGRFNSLYFHHHAYNNHTLNMQMQTMDLARGACRTRSSVHARSRPELFSRGACRRRRAPVRRCRGPGGFQPPLARRCRCRWRQGGRREERDRGEERRDERAGKKGREGERGDRERRQRITGPRLL
jgi:hypothetical protein